MKNIKNFREITINVQDLEEKGNDFIISQQEVKVDLSPNTKSDYFGRFVSKSFATDAVNKFEALDKKLAIPQLNDLRRINFSKELINLILAQEECEGISVFFCLPPSQELLTSATQERPIALGKNEVDKSRDKISVLLMGVKRDGNPMTVLDGKKDESDYSIMVEVGGHENPRISTTGLDFFSNELI